MKLFRSPYALDNEMDRLKQQFDRDYLRTRKLNPAQLARKWEQLQKQLRRLMNERAKSVEILDDLRAQFRAEMDKSA